MLALLAAPGQAQSLPCEGAITGGESRFNGPASRWERRPTPEAPGGMALTEASRLALAERYPICILPAPQAVDLDVTLTFKPLSGRLDRAGGIALRVRDANTYYVLRANAAEDNVRLYHVVRGQRVQFAGREGLPIGLNQWHRLRLRVEGENFAAWLDGQPILTARDRHIPGPGRVALWSIADSETLFQTPAIEVLR
jgi:hypothetical protein